MSRVRRVPDRRELEASADEFITRGYRVVTEHETATRLKKRDWGDSGTHLILAALTGWWTFGLSNVLYAIYTYATAEEILITIDDEIDDDQ